MRVTYPGEGNEGECGHGSKHDGGDQHDQSYQNVVAEEGDGCQPTTEKSRKKTLNTISSKLMLILDIHEHFVSEHYYQSILDYILFAIMIPVQYSWMLNAKQLCAL